MAKHTSGIKIFIFCYRHSYIRVEHSPLGMSSYILVLSQRARNMSIRKNIILFLLFICIYVMVIMHKIYENPFLVFYVK